MTDEPDETPSPPALSLAEEDEVRGLLAEASGSLPTPPDVVARLDATLVRLVSEQQDVGPADGPVDDPVDDPVGDPEPATTALDPTPPAVTSLASRRPRWPKLLLAAAAVVVVGYGLGAVVDGTQMGSDDADSGSAGGSSAESMPETATKGGSLDSDRAPSNGMLRATQGIPRLTADDFDSDVRRLVGPVETSGLAADSEAQNDAGRRERSGCAVPPSSRRDTWYVVRYDGRPATLVVTPPRRGTVDVRVFSCDGTVLVRDSRVDLR